MSEKEKNKENNQKKFDLQDRFSDYVLYAYNHYSVIFRSISHTACGKKDEMLNIFSTLSNSPYLRRESISFCRSQFPSHSIGGRVSLPREISFYYFYVGLGVNKFFSPAYFQSQP